ncbi:hypothetical protein DVH24_013310 [Malus domestica]|uniref:Uncharacterized protein n=1 Tax=Malus domestica TaxID=3750 RepID=A0A498HJR3_MALDO|nr:hypothetical protein DVH24_013310 [Malus domestica]
MCNRMHLMLKYPTSIVFVKNEEFKYHNLTPTNTEAFVVKSHTCRTCRLETISELLEVDLWPVSLIISTWYQNQVVPCVKLNGYTCSTSTFFILSNSFIVKPQLSSYSNP